MMERVTEIYEQRDEILEAFVAKYGFAPDECEQVEQKTETGSRWFVVKLYPEHAAKVAESVLRYRYSTVPLTRWQRFCFWLGTGKWTE